MCRLFGLHGPSPIPLYRLLVAGDNSFAAQSLEHPDGWGIAYWEQQTPTLVKSILPAICDERFEDTCFRVSAPSVICHLRKATVGKVCEANCHPFLHQGWVFAHNGHIFGVEEKQAELLDLCDRDVAAAMQGQTDSELYFGILLRELKVRGLGTVHSLTAAHFAAAFFAAITAIEAVTRPTRLVDQKSSYTCLLGNGQTLVGLSYGMPLAVQSQPITGAKSTSFLLSSEPISAKGFETSLQTRVELDAGQLIYIGPDYTIQQASIDS